MSILLPLIGLAAAIILLVVLVKLLKKERMKQITPLWQEYQQALKSGDKQAALRAGRRYYQSVRGGRLTIYDEQAITNDLAAMK